MVEPFTTPIPEAFLKDPNLAEWARQVHLRLDNLFRPAGVLSESEDTAETVVTQQGQLDAVIAQAAATDAVLDALSAVLDSYAISNDGTSRTLNADDAAGAISATYVQAELENVRDAVLALADVVATHLRDERGAI